MTNPSDLSPLIERIEAAEEGSLELSRAVRDASNAPAHWFIVDPQFYTSSIDAIVGLIESEFGAWGAAIGSSHKGGATLYLKERQNGTQPFKGKGHTPALALCACFLKALQERGEG